MVNTYPQMLEPTPPVLGNIWQPCLMECHLATLPKPRFNGMSSGNPAKAQLKAGSFHYAIQLAPFNQQVFVILILCVDSYPTQWIQRKDVIKRPGLKCTNKPELVIKGSSNIQSNTFFNDAAKVWNEAPNDIKECKTLCTVKKLIKRHIQSLPI